MQYLDSYIFSINWAGQETNLDPADFSFSIRDSIHNFFSEISFEVKDITGLFQEAYLNTDSIPLSISYGIVNQSNLSCNYVIDSDETKSTYSSDSIGGPLKLKATHAYYDLSEEKSDAYPGRISDVIQNLVSTEYGFSHYNINDTGCDITWYRPLYTQREFIEKILLPNAYSYNSHESPFFCWIDSNNGFNLRNYYSMITTNSYKTYKLVNYNGSNNKLLDGIIMDLRRMKVGSYLTKKYWNRDLWSRDRYTGEENHDMDHITDYPSGQKGQLPILENNLDSGCYDLIYSETDPNLLDCFKGRKINSTKDAMFLERFILTVPLDTNILAGTLLELDLPIKQSNSGGINSLSYSDKYLCESVDHVWSGTKRLGYTQCIISRKFVTVPNNSLIKLQMMVGS